MTTRCRRCGREFERSDGRTGRPAAYCSTGCRRSAEYEARRLQRQLGDVEDDLRRHRISWAGDRATGVERAKRLEAERVRLEERLREVLDDGYEEMT